MAKGSKRKVSGTDGLFAVGLLLSAAGLAAFDWRVALIVVGVALMGLAVAAARQSARRGE